jgi:hypothetical protein
MNAVLYAGSDSFDLDGNFTPPMSPLYKLRCDFCPDYIAKKDTDKHVAEAHDLPEEQPPQSAREAYFNAH